MKRVLVILVAVAFSLSFYSCEPACKKDNTGDVTITNNTDEALWFDVTGAEGATTENRQVQPGSSTTYTIAAGTAKVWASFVNNNDDFVLVQTYSLAQCATEMFATPSQACSLLDVTDVKVENNYSFSIVIDVWLGDDNEGYFLGEHTVAAGSSYTYTKVPVTSIEFWARDAAGTQWTYIGYYNLNACQLFTFSWESSKSLELIKGDKRIETPRVSGKK